MEKKLEQQVIEYYRQARLPQEQMMALLQANCYASSARQWQQRCYILGSVTVLLLVFSVGLLFLRSASPSPPEKIVIQKETPIPEEKQSIPVQPTRAKLVTENMMKPLLRLVSFRSHSDACPHCRETGEVYQQLVADFQNKAVVLEEIDLSQAAHTAAVQKRIDELQVRPLIAGRIETAFLVLVNEDGKALREFKPSQSATRIASQVTELIDQQVE